MDRNSEQAVSDVRLGAPVVYERSIGDTWDPAWAADGRLYTPGNDGSGWDGGCSSNVFFSTLAGDDPASLAGANVNCMTEYGGWAKAGFDECTWKSAGCLSLDGALYLSVARHRYGRLPGDPHGRQIAERASIIMSSDSGRTWSRPERDNYLSAMWPGRRFATHYFVHYGRDGAAPDRDNARTYVYAVSNNGFWCNGDDYVLGRIRRDRMDRLDPADWQYYRGVDGMLDSAWTANLEEARPVISSPLQCGETGPTYLVDAGRYVLVAWYYPGDPNVDTDRTHFAFYEAPAPWGPWTRFGETVNWPVGWYCPRVLSRWQRRDGDELHAVIATGGDYWQAEHYKLTLVPVALKLGGSFAPSNPEPLPLVVNDDQTGAGPNRIEYTGDWEHERARFRAHNRDEHHSSSTGAGFRIAFDGSRIRWYGSKQASCGIAAVSIDAGSEVEVDCHTHSPSTQFERLLYDSGVLPRGSHLFSVQVTGRGNEYAKGTRIFSDRIEIFP